MVVESLKSKVRRRGHHLQDLSSNHGYGQWQESNHGRKPVSPYSRSLNKIKNSEKLIYSDDDHLMKKDIYSEWDEDFMEGIKDLFENYDTTLKNLVNR